MGNVVGTDLVGKLTATGIAALKAAGRYQDGDGLMLVIGATGARSWMLRVKEPGTAGKRRDIGLGSLKDVTLAEARKRPDWPRWDSAIQASLVPRRYSDSGIPICGFGIWRGDLVPRSPHQIKSQESSQ